MNWDQVASEVSSIVSAVAPIASAVLPEEAAAIGIAAAIIKGAAAAEPTAMALINQVNTGMAPTSAQLAAYYASYVADDDALNADIASHLAGAK